MSRQVVLGAGGFIGTNLCRRLVERGITPHGFGHAAASSDALPDMPYTVADFEDRDALASALDGADLVYHLLGTRTISGAEADRRADLKRNVDATLMLLDLLCENAVGRVVFISSGGTVYGVPDALPIPETAATMPVSAYGIGKLTIEKYLHMYWHQHGLNYQVARLANPYGPHQRLRQGQGVVPALLKCRYASTAFPLWGDGEVLRDYVYIDDAVDGLIALAGHAGGPEIVNIGGGGNGTSLTDLIAGIEQITDGSIQIDRQPARAADIPANLLDITKAREMLGWAPPTRLETGLERTAEWFRAHEVAGA